MGKKMVDWTALDRRVITIAVEGEVKDWAAYIGAVEGKDHEREWEEIMHNGTKLPREVAEILFPTFKKLNWRY